MSEIKVQDLEALAEKLSKMRADIELDKAMLSEKNEALEKVEGELMAALKELGKTSYKSNFGTISVVQKWRVNLPNTPEDKEALLTYLREKDLESMLTVNSNTLNSYYMQEWETVKASGDPEAAMNFSIPGIKEPKLNEIISFRKK